MITFNLYFQKFPEGNAVFHKNKAAIHKTKFVTEREEEHSSEVEQSRNLNMNEHLWYIKNKK